MLRLLAVRRDALAAVTGVMLFLGASPVDAHYYGGQAPRCERCLPCPCSTTALATGLSLTEGNLTQSFDVFIARSAFGPTLGLSLFYQSFNADDSQASVDTGLGYGWTHSYNPLLFAQRSHMFLMDGGGRIRKYTRGAGGAFASAPGFFETLVQNADGTFVLTEKGGTVMRFAAIAGAFIVPGVAGPVYRLMEVVDRNGNTTSLSYDATGRLVAVTDTYARRLTLEYEPVSGKLVRVTDPLSRATTFTYDATSRQLLTITDAGGRVTRFQYNSRHQLTKKTDRDNRTFSYVYQNGKPVAVRDGSGRDIHRLSNPSNWGIDAAKLATDLVRAYIPSTAVLTDGRGQSWRYTYDEHGYVTRLEAPDGAITRYTYDPATLMVTSLTDANGNATVHSYDGLGNLVETVDALGHTTSYSYEPAFSQMTRKVDANGRITLYEYDAAGNRIAETNPLGDVRRWTYDVHGNVLTQTDWRGAISEFQYDATGNAVSRIEDSTGLRVTTRFVHDRMGNLLSALDARGHLTSFEYDALDRRVRETDPLLGITQLAYDGEGHSVRVVDPKLQATSFRYDLRGRLLQTTDALGGVMSASYDGNDNRVTSRDENGNTTRYEYDAQNRLARVVDAHGHATAHEYDPQGNLTSTTDANGHVSRYEYDALNRQIRVTDPTGAMTVLEYDATGEAVCGECSGPTRGSDRVAKRIDGNGKTTYFKYDGLDRTILQIRKEGDAADARDGSDAVTEYEYDANGNRLTTIEPNGDVSSAVYDALNRRVAETDAAGDVTRFRYDGVDNVIEMVSPNGNVTMHEYDADDRIVRTADLEGTVKRFSYDPVGNQLAETDGNGNTTRFTYDKRNRLTRVVDPAGAATSYQYDLVGNLLKVVDRNSNVTTHTYDALNRRVSTTDALLHVTGFEYDAVGNRVRVVDAKAPAGVTTYEYDGMNRRIAETFADDAPSTRRFTYDGVGNLVARTDQQGRTTRYVYDDLYFLKVRDYAFGPDDRYSHDLSGRILTAERDGWIVRLEYDGPRITRSVQNGLSVSYLYDIPGRTRRLAYPGGRTITEATDARGRLMTVNDGAAVGGAIAAFAYDAADRVTSRTYRNGTASTYQYNSNDWMTSVEHTAGSRRVAGFGYAYDKEGNKRFEQKRHDPSRSEAYTYDKAYRLVTFRVGTLVGSVVTVPLTQTAYDLDPVGNWNVRTVDGIPETRTHNAVDEIDAIDGIPFVHDDSGNLAADPERVYEYDEENRLTRVIRTLDGAVLGQYRYDAFGRRVARQASLGGTAIDVLYVYDDDRVIEERTPAGATRATYVYGDYVDEVLTMDRGGQVFFYHENAMHSIAALTDAAGVTVEGYRYDAYGRQSVITPGANGVVDFGGDDIVFDGASSSVGNPVTFTGREVDAETGLMFYRARTYHPSIGRFIQRDPLGQFADTNLYEYVSSRPTARVDPSGLFEGYLIEGDGGGGPCRYCGPDVSAYYASELIRLERWVSRFQDTNYWTWRFARWGAFYDIAVVLDWWHADGTSITLNVVSEGKPTTVCPSPECKGSVWLCGMCVDSHILGNIAYGFVGRLLEFKWLTLRAGAHAHNVAEHGALDPEGSRAAYDIGETIAERTMVITERKLCRMIERRKARYIAAWNSHARNCDPCPLSFPPSAWPLPGTFGPKGEIGGVDFDK